MMPILKAQGFSPRPAIYRRHSNPYYSVIVAHHVLLCAASCWIGRQVCADLESRYKWFCKESVTKGHPWYISAKYVVIFIPCANKSQQWRVRGMLGSHVDDAREIQNFIPGSAYSDGEASSKFSLYLLGQLLYGTVLIYDRQVTLLHSHVRWAYESCKRLRMEGSLPQSSKGAPSSARKGARRSEVVEEPRTDIDVTEQPEGRFVGLARRSEITMTESQPIIWKREDLFQDEAVQAPVQISKERFIDWNEQRSSNSKDSLKVALVVKKEPATVEAASVTEELPPFPPPEVFQNMDRESFLAGTQPTFDAGGNDRRESVANEQRSVVDAQPPNENEPLLKRLRLDNGSLLSSSEESEKESTNPSLELPSLDENLEIVQPSPRGRRKPLQSIDTNGTTISIMSMKEMQMDYSSLVKTVDELRSGIPVAADRHPSLHELLLPYPAYAGKKFPKECIGLYRSRFCDNMTFKQAITENLDEPINRGDASTLWHYSSTDQSSKESSEQRRTPGIAYALYDTPERVRATASSHEDTNRRYSDDQFPVHLTPGSFKLLKTPGRELPLAEVDQGGVARPGDFDMGRRDAAYSTGSRTPLGDFSLLANTVEASQLAADATLQESGLRRESRSSYLEQARRLTGWTDESRRPSSVQLRDSSQGGNVTQRDTSEKLHSLSSSDSGKMSPMEELLVRRVRESNKFIPLSSIIPTATTSKRKAAAMFSTLLNLIRKSSVEARQMEPFGEIWIRNHSVRSSSDYDFDALASTSQPFQ